MQLLDWTVLPDVSKQFVTGNVNDIQVLDANTGWLSSSGGTVLRATNGGQMWTAALWAVPGTTASAQSFTSASLYAYNGGWAVGTYKVNDVTHQFLFKQEGSSQTDRWGDLPTGFVPKSVGAVSADEASPTSAVWGLEFFFERFLAGISVFAERAGSGFCAETPCSVENFCLHLL